MPNTLHFAQRTFFPPLSAQVVGACLITPASLDVSALGVALSSHVMWLFMCLVSSAAANGQRELEFFLPKIKILWNEA